MRIAFIVTEFPSRSQTFVRDQIAGLLERGHSVDVFAVHSGVSDHEPIGIGAIVNPASRLRTLAWAACHPLECVGVLRAARWSRSTFGSAIRFAATHGSTRYDVVHCHFGPNGNIGGALLDVGRLKGALVVTFHGYDLSSYLIRSGRRVYSRLCTKADLLLTVTERWRALLLELGCDPARVRVHRMGVDTAGIEQVSHDTPSTLEVVTVARLVEKKGIQFAIRAIARMPQTPNVRYTIVGDGPLRGQLEALIDSLDVRNRVIITGWAGRTEVQQVIHRSHIAVVPSVRARDGDEEGLPVFLMEAMAAGLAVVATEHSGIPELVRNETDGLLVPERDAAAIARALMLFAGSTELRRTFGANARRRVVEHHEVQRLTDELVEHYVDAIRRQPAHDAA